MSLSLGPPTGDDEMTVPCLRWLCCVLLCATAVNGEQSRASGATNDIDFRGLDALAKRYGLRFPPKEGVLVLGTTGCRPLVGSSSTSLDPKIYHPAFLLERLPKGQARVLMGWEEKVVRNSAEHCPATRPYSLVPQKLALGAICWNATTCRHS